MPIFLCFVLFHFILFCFVGFRLACLEQDFEKYLSHSYFRYSLKCLYMYTPYLRYIHTPLLPLSLSSKIVPSPHHVVLKNKSKTNLLIQTCTGSQAAYQWTSASNKVAISQQSSTTISVSVAVDIGIPSWLCVGIFNSLNLCKSFAGNTAPVSSCISIITNITCKSCCGLCSNLYRWAHVSDTKDILSCYKSTHGSDNNISPVHINEKQSIKNLILVIHSTAGTIK